MWVSLALRHNGRLGRSFAPRRPSRRSTELRSEMPMSISSGRKTMKDIRRRAFMQGAALGALAFTVGGVEVLLTAAEAKARGVPFRLLNLKEAETIEALGETLVPGARAAGVAHFVDQQLSARRARRCSRRVSSTSNRRLPISTERPSVRSMAAVRSCMEPNSRS